MRVDDISTQAPSRSQQQLPSQVRSKESTAVDRSTGAGNDNARSSVSSSVSANASSSSSSSATNTSDTLIHHHCEELSCDESDTDQDEREAKESRENKENKSTHPSWFSDYRRTYRAVHKLIDGYLETKQRKNVGMSKLTRIHKQISRSPFDTGHGKRLSSSFSPGPLEGAKSAKPKKRTSVVINSGEHELQSIMCDVLRHYGPISEFVGVGSLVGDFSIPEEGMYYLLNTSAVAATTITQLVLLLLLLPATIVTTTYPTTTCPRTTTTLLLLLCYYTTLLPPKESTRTCQLLPRQL